MKQSRTWRYSGLAPVAAAAILAVATPAGAEIIMLDCDVGIQSNSNYMGEPRSSSRHSGTWRFRLDTVGSRATLLEAPFVYRVGSTGDPFNDDGLSVPLTTTEDAYTFCIARQGSQSCNQRTALPDGEWYNVNTARIDRRRGTFRVTVEEYSDLLRGRAVADYSGTCQPAPEQQF